VLASAALVGSAAYAYSASNSMPASAPSAGLGSSSISGYTVSGVSYTLNATNPQNIDQVAFTISPSTATTVKGRLSSSGSWYACTNTAGSVTCATTSPQATVSGASSLEIVATQ
jgi:hypothetical protein